MSGLQSSSVLADTVLKNVWVNLDENYICLGMCVKSLFLKAVRMCQQPGAFLLR